MKKKSHALDHSLERGDKIKNLLYEVLLPFAVDVPTRDLWEYKDGAFVGRSTPKARCIGSLPFGLK